MLITYLFTPVINVSGKVITTDTHYRKLMEGMFESPTHEVFASCDEEDQGKIQIYLEL